MTKEELKSLLGSRDLGLLDVRTGKDWAASEFKIKGAMRAEPKRFCPLYARSDDLFLNHVLIAALKGYHASFS